MKITDFLKTLIICTFGVLLFGLFFVPASNWLPFASDFPDFLVDIPIWTLIGQSGLLVFAGLVVSVIVILLKS